MQGVWSGAFGAPVQAPSIFTYGGQRRLRRACRPASCGGLVSGEQCLQRARAHGERRLRRAEKYGVRRLRRADERRRRRLRRAEACYLLSSACGGLGRAELSLRRAEACYLLSSACAACWGVLSSACGGLRRAELRVAC